MKIYAGETLKGVMVLKDENDAPITNLSSYDIVIMLRNKYDDYSVVLKKTDLSISGSSIGFQFTSEQTKPLVSQGVLELKVTQGGVVKIAREDLFNVVDNKIKDFVE